MTDQSRERLDRDAAARAEDERLRHNIPPARGDVQKQTVHPSDIDIGGGIGVGKLPSDRDDQLDRIESKLDRLLDALEVDDE